IFKPYTNRTDLGRGAIVKSDDDFDENYQFKVPTLRNVTATAPYFHDGGSPTLPETVRAMAKMQLSLDLNEEQVQDLVNFLHCLEGKGLSMETASPSPSEPVLDHRPAAPVESSLSGSSRAP